MAVEHHSEGDNPEGGRQGADALLLAAGENRLDVLDRLLVAGANPNARAEGVLYAIHAAAEAGHAEAVRRLLAAGADPDVEVVGTTPLMAAVENGHVAVVEALLAAGAAADGPQSADDATPLMTAAREGRAEIVGLLLASGVPADPPRAPVREELTPLVLAAQGGHAAAVRALLAGGADPSRADPRGKTAHQWALLTGHRGVAALLRPHGATISPAEFLAAAKEGDVAAVTAALDAGTAVDVQEKAVIYNGEVLGGVTALMLAVRGGHLDVVDCLLNAGANIDAISNDRLNSQRTALNFADEAGEKGRAIVERLRASRRSK